MKKSIQALAIYEKKVKEMGFEETPMLLPRHAAAASGSGKIPGITKALDTIMTDDGAMDVDDSGGISDLIAELSKGSGSDKEDGALWPGFR